MALWMIRAGSLGEYENNLLPYAKRANMGLVYSGKKT